MFTDKVPDETWWQEGELAKFLRIPRRRLQKIRDDGMAPPHVRIGHLILYPDSELDEWLKFWEGCGDAEINRPERACP